jgi:hypothetical protein
MDGYLAKPIQGDHLVELVERCLESDQQRASNVLMPPTMGGQGRAERR